MIVKIDELFSIVLGMTWINHSSITVGRLLAVILPSILLCEMSYLQTTTISVYLAILRDSPILLPRQTFRRDSSACRWRGCSVP